MDTETLDRYGYYVVCGKKYYNKLEAFKVAFSQGYHPHWYFHEDTFDSVDWTVEPDKDLKTLYADRAQQLRNKYNKLILSFSGGTDSSTVADTFVYNGIKLDYLLNRNLTDSLRLNGLEKHESNMHNEPVLVAQPLYEQYRKIQPDLKYVSWNYIDRMVDFWNNTPDMDPYLWNSYSPNTIIKDNILELFSHLENTSRCIIHAIDKPIIFYINGRFYMTFQDNFVCHHAPSTTSFNEKAITTELFFWSKDSVELLKKQAHAMKKFFKCNPHLLSLISKFPYRKIDNYREIVAAAVYDKSKLQMWQPDKANANWLLASEKWFYDNDSQALENWKKFYFAFESEANIIFKEKASELYAENKDNFKFYGEKLFNGLPSCYSKLYDIGE